MGWRDPKGVDNAKAQWPLPARASRALSRSRALDGILRARGIPASIDYWSFDVNHDWPWWFKPMNHFLGRIYG